MAVAMRPAAITTPKTFPLLISLSPSMKPSGFGDPGQSGYTFTRLSV
jgi:hypothetical protein